MNAISPLTAGTPSQKKPRMLVVDDEPDNLDLLYRTFRREYQVLRAESGVQALEVLKDEGEVAVIISDQRMPEMTGTEFLSKTVPEFPDTVRIILTGFTDVEDLVQAINAGQVYRYITKPWDPDELKAVVQRATDTYELLKQRTAELNLAEKQTKLLTTVGQLAVQAMSLEDVLQLLADGLGQVLNADICAVQTDAALGLHGSLDNAHQLLTDNPLVQQAITTQATQAAPNLEQSEDGINHGLYSASRTRSHLVVPIVYQGQYQAVISLQWEQAYQTLDDVSYLLQTVAAQTALGLKALSC
ncbi:MAG: response regulator [Cyanobacteria bacterium P01_A01_bin.105]